MTDQANTNEISVLSGLAMQARALRLSIEMNMFQLARVFTEAKELVPHGEWEKWLKDNADVSVRTAQDMMAAYRRFGNNPQFEGLGQATVFRLLPLPKGTEERFMAEHDVSVMTTREIQEAVRKEREKAQEEITRERNARIAAEKRAAEAAARPADIPDDLADRMRADQKTIEAQKNEIQRLAAIGNEMIEEQRRLTKENSDLQREAQEREELLAEQQEDLSRAQQELLSVRSAIAKGDAERLPSDQLTPDVFARAVRAFIGTVARMPHMRAAFAAMGHDDKEEYSVLLSTVEEWAADSRKALETTSVEGTVVMRA